MAKLLGKDEVVRWMNLALYQGAPAKKGITTMVHIIYLVSFPSTLIRSCFESTIRQWQPRQTPSSQKKPPEIQPCFVPDTNDPDSTCSLALGPSACYSLDTMIEYLTQRLAFFTDRDSAIGDRDVFNERPTREEQSVASTAHGTAGNKSGPSPHANSATLHTTMGDIHIRLFPQQAPKAVENFVSHARSGYFENVVFHRVIPKFMIQTGDPLGDGTGGTSIWGREFEDEFSDDLKHDRCVFLLIVLDQHFDLLLFPSSGCTSDLIIIGHIQSAWPMLALVRTARSFSLQRPPPHGWTESTQSLEEQFRVWKSYTRLKT